MGRNEPAAHALGGHPPRVLWQGYCAMVPEIRRLFGVNDALGYVVGEKLMAFCHAAETLEGFSDELPAFCQTIRDMFTPSEIEGYFAASPGSDESPHALADSQAERDRRAWVKAMLLRMGS